MSNTRHHGKKFNQDEAHHRRAIGYEYLGRDVFMDADRQWIKKARRMMSKQILELDNDEGGEG